MHCHNRGGRTGVSYLGMMEADPYGYPWGTKPGEKSPKVHGKWYNMLLPDIHYERGMHCVDCHLDQEIHGDGNIYSKKWQAVAIECETCHGTPWSPPTFQTRYGKLPNVVEEGGKYYLVNKVTGEKHEIPLLKDLVEEGKLSKMGYVAMVAVKQHIEKLECYACHAKWAPQCYGCHVQVDLSTPDNDWLTYDPKAADKDPSMVASQANRVLAAFKVRETRSFLRWDRVPLGWNPEGKVSPYIPGCQDIWTIIGPDGKVIKHNEPFTTYDGYPSVAFAPIQPHTIRPEARTCAECHMDPKALGLGDEVFRFKESGLPVDITKLVDENGRQLLSINHPNARPFNRDEIQKILRVGTCLGCHASYSDPVWSDVRKFTSVALNPEAHIEAVSKIFGKASEALSAEEAGSAGPTAPTATVTETRTVTTTEIRSATVTTTITAGGPGVSAGVVAIVAIVAAIVGASAAYMLSRRSR